MGNASVRMKIMMSLGGLVAGYILLLSVVLWSTSITAEHIDRSSKILFPAALSSQKAETGFQKAARHYQDAVAQRDVRDISPADKDLTEVLNSLSDLNRRTPPNSARLTQIGQLIAVTAQLQQHAQLIYPEIIANPETTNETTLHDVAQLGSDTKRLAEGLAALRIGTISDFDTELKETSLWARRARVITVCILLVAALWVFASVILLQKQIVLPIETLSARLRDIAEGDGDLTKRLEVEGGDELGQVASSFNVFMDQLHAIIRQVTAGTLHLASATTEIAATSAQIAQRADRQQQEAEQIAIAMHEMAGSVADVSSSSHSAAEKARHAVALANQGETAVQEAISRMRVVTDSVEEASAQMTELGLRSKQIGKIVVLISDITTQTNLLALNAAIEAARAGEHGRGFGVVAGEVRNLADRTAKATDQISEMIMLLQSGTDAAVETMRHSSAQVQLGMEASTSTGDSFRRIIEAVEQGADMITRVASATTQQAIGTDGVNDNVGRIAIMTKESAVGAKKSADAVAELATLAINLKQMIANFRLEDVPGDLAAMEIPGTRKLPLYLARA